MMEKIKINAKFQYFMINSKIPTVISCEYFEVNYNESYSYNNKHTQTVISKNQKPKTQSFNHDTFPKNQILNNKNNTLSYLNYNQLCSKSQSISDLHKSEDTSNCLSNSNSNAVFPFKRQKSKTVTLSKLPNLRKNDSSNDCFISTKSMNSRTSSKNNLKENIENINVPGCFVKNIKAYDRVLQGFVYIRTLPYIFPSYDTKKGEGGGSGNGNKRKFNKLINK